MKNGMKKLRRLVLIMLCVVLIAPCMCMNVSAASQRQRALSAYKKWLSSSRVCVLKRGAHYTGSDGISYLTYRSTKATNVKFALAYIDNDNIPELIVYTKGGIHGLYGVLTYKNGKVRRVSSSDGWTVLMGYYKKTGYILEKGYTEGCIVHKIYCKKVGNKLVSKFTQSMHGYDSGSDYVIHKSSSKWPVSISKKTFYTKLRKEIRGQKKISFKFYKNTAANRKAKLK